MGTGRQTVRDLVEEGKKRVVLLLVCVFGLSYLMSLTSSSVWVNLPAAASLIIFLRYISRDLDVRRRSSSSNRPKLLNKSSRGRSIELPEIPIDKLSWRRKVNSPVVEAAIDQLTRHLVSEWVTDLWYSRITPDKDGPEELVQMINGVLGEVSCRARDINLINMLTRDIIDLFCSHLELYRSSQGKIGKEELSTLSIDDRDAKLKLAMAEENRLHPALVSVEAEHKVLQDLVSGLISLTFKPDDLRCSYFRFTVREILACAVIRPVLNLANPRFINEKVESLVISLSKKTDGFTSSEGLPRIRPSGLSRASMDQLPGSSDHSNAGVELVQFKHDSLNTSSAEKVKQNSNESKNHRADISTDERHTLAGGEWAHMLDVISTRKTRALAPEHFENMWTKGRNYKRNEDSNWTTGQVGQGATLQADDSPNASSIQINGNHATHASASSFQEKLARRFNKGDAGVDSDSSYETDDDDSNNVTGLNSPGTRVNTKKVDVSDESETESWGRVHSGSTASSSLSNVSPSDDYKSLLKPSDNFVMEESFLKLRCEVLGANIVKSGLGTFAVYSISVSDATNNSWSIKRRSNFSIYCIRFRHFEELHRRLKEFSEYHLNLPPKHFLSSGLEVPVVKERCKLLDKYLKNANDIQHQLQFSFYAMFLMLISFLQMLLQLPSVSESIEVWDFLSVDSQTYIFSDSFSIIQTLSVDLDDKSSEKGGKLKRTDENVNDHLRRRKEHLRSINEGSSPSNTDFESDTSVFKKTNAGVHLIHGSRIAENQLQGNLGGQSEVRHRENNSSVNSVKPVKIPIQGDKGKQHPALSLLEAVTDPTIPIEWAPPNLSMPILDLVDAVFQLQDGGWMRRQVFWIAKQVLQLGMGDAFDDWLIEKIQLLRQGSVVAHAIKRVEQVCLKIICLIKCWSIRVDPKVIAARRRLGRLKIDLQDHRVAPVGRHSDVQVNWQCQLGTEGLPRPEISEPFLVRKEVSEKGAVSLVVADTDLPQQPRCIPLTGPSLLPGCSASHPLEDATVHPLLDSPTALPAEAPSQIPPAACCHSATHDLRCLRMAFVEGVILPEILWPDGIFITKHPSRKHATPLPSPKEGCTQKDNRSANLLTDEEQVEASRRAKVVHELIIERCGNDSLWTGELLEKQQKKKKREVSWGERGLPLSWLQMTARRVMKPAGWMMWVSTHARAVLDISCSVLTATTTAFFEKAPAALVGLVGRKEYERCAEDVYFFLQSSLCLRQLAIELLELLLLAAFPELDVVVRKFHQDKERARVVKGK
ncbi:hypothetical protein Taro_007511 [Colocasia esculenta]|uniref:Uncharacterized protein n=1 Tax=Colocasia esculenta TaxID=4460 RepID=A0A843TZ70_COLES|nr:hypothetical protein [Colocasia esculenta]